MKTYHYILIAVFSYLFFALGKTPAITILSLLEKNIDMPAKFYGIQGSVWNGQMDTIIIPSQPQIDNFKWSINPLSFLLASFSADIEADIKAHKVSGNIGISISGNIYAEDIRAQLKAEDVQDLLMLPLGELAGDFELSIDSIEWANEGLPKTTGQISWNNAKLTLVETVDLGQVNAIILPMQDNGLKILIKNTNGMLGIDGSIEITGNKQYKLAIEFKPNNAASSSVTQSLAMFSKRQSNGSYRFNKSGNLNQLGF